ncbi:HNH endonuclease [Halobium salinum]|uniref:HNH endonuclease n=1 Tax=Halobium salinum TaxID=1364940 RepID=A0ABD5PFZ2_9EURY|nr:HNH endonuclease [Halobium salinum]
MNVPGPRRPIEIGETFSQSAVEAVFETDFGYQFKGITYRRPDAGKYVILLANEGALYEDELDEADRFVYIGEGTPEKGDQEPTTANQALMDAVSDPIPTYLFSSRDGVDEYRYEGLVVVDSYRYVSDGERMVYRFEMRKLGVGQWEEITRIESDYLESTEQPSLTEDASPTFREVKSRVRDSLFPKRVKRAYDHRCAVCGKKRLTPDGRPEVEAAHIYPKWKNGADDPRNGIALCRLHHWAFDEGWFTLTDDLKVRIESRTTVDPPEAVTTFGSERIREPEHPKLRPAPVYLAAHRELHGFE